MSALIIQGDNGKPAGVFIPIKDWEIMKTQYKNLEAWEEADPTKEEILDGIKQAISELNLVNSGELKARPLKDLLDEL
jgi:PHD/YefM family antitoxin component YafN of YafNO toxin-antitoxin module